MCPCKESSMVRGLWLTADSLVQEGRCRQKPSQKIFLVCHLFVGCLTRGVRRCCTELLNTVWVAFFASCVSITKGFVCCRWHEKNHWLFPQWPIVARNSMHVHGAPSTLFRCLCFSLCVSSCYADTQKMLWTSWKCGALLELTWMLRTTAGRQCCTWWAPVWCLMLVLVVSVTMKNLPHAGLMNFICDFSLQLAR